MKVRIEKGKSLEVRGKDAAEEETDLMEDEGLCFSLVWSGISKQLET